ncbi:MAG: holin, BlyA family protein [Lachnospiraceae bacterium]|nr:holin, BlyA family protein [Lachnospira sp.]MBQ8731172.1 holin, BlyA family protein [Lachnospiraceae bacterium]
MKKLMKMKMAAIGVVEIILILVVLVGLVVIFKEQVTNLVNSIMQRVMDAANGL